MSRNALNFLGDAIDRFATLENDVERWGAAVDLISKVGGSALNVASVDPATSGISWARSSMRQSWLDDYMTEGFQYHDPLIADLTPRGQMTVLRAGTLTRGDTSGAKELDLNHGLKDAGYRSLTSAKFAGYNVGENKLVVVSSDMDADEFYRGCAPDMLRLLTTIIAGQVGAPDDYTQPNVVPVNGRPLSERERDVLSLLALGLRNDAIAEQLGIAEVSVRKHILSARQKLNASTREQALVKAIRQGQIKP